MSETKQTNKAAALKYDPKNDRAPVIAALGQGHVAEKIVQTAEEHGVPIVQDSGLTEVLSALSVGDTIPRQLYEAVAQVLVFVSQQDANYKNRLKF